VTKGFDMVEDIAKKKLLIGFSRTCACKPNNLNCLTAKEWIKSQLGVWEFNYEKRDIRDKTLHPAVFPISLATKVIQLFTHKGELVLDPFCGAGTTLLAAKDNERNAIGFDLNQKYIELSTSRLAQSSLVSETKQMALCDDARNIQSYIEPETVKLIFTSPPYANLLNRKRTNKSWRADTRKNIRHLVVDQYSQDPRDLGTLDIEGYTRELTQIYKELYPLLKIGGHNVINVTDMWWSEDRPGAGRRVPIHIYVYKALTDAGFELKNTIIWNRLNIVNKIGIFGYPSNYITMGTTFEYILDFWKPKK
jgi:DNA modification methylase